MRWTSPEKTQSRCRARSRGTGARRGTGRRPRRNFGGPASPPKAPAKATGLKLWTSLDDGVTWQAADVSGTGGTYSARLPHAGKGQAMSLRVEATDSGGGRIDQTILRAYFGA